MGVPVLLHCSAGAGAGVGPADSGQKDRLSFPFSDSASTSFSHSMFSPYCGVHCPWHSGESVSLSWNPSLQSTVRFQAKLNLCLWKMGSNGSSRPEK